VDDFTPTFEKLCAISRAKGWPGVEEGQSWGTPALKVKGKMLVRVREPGILVILCSLEKKQMLMQVAPEIYFETPHYNGYPAVLVRMDNIDPEELAEHIEITWRELAGKKLVAEFDDAGGTTDVKPAPKKKARAKATSSKLKPASKAKPSLKD
jgi:hypothetical protein